MFSSALRTAARAAARPALKATRPAAIPAFRVAALSTSAIRRSGEPAPSLFGPGGKAGEVPSDLDQATGLERLQVLGEAEGFEVFDEAPLDSDRIGTQSDPIKVFSLDTERIVGCTGAPADSHDILWLNLRKEKQSRCPECGSVYELDFQGSEDAHHHH